MTKKGDPRRLPPGVAHAPDRVRAVVGDQQRAIGRDRHADRATPDIAVGQYKAGQEVLVLAGRRVRSGAAARESLRSRRDGLRFHEPCCAAKMSPLVLRRKLLAFVEHHLQRGIVRPARAHPERWSLLFSSGCLPLAADRDCRRCSNRASRRSRLPARG